MAEQAAVRMRPLDSVVMKGSLCLAGRVTVQRWGRGAIQGWVEYDQRSREQAVYLGQRLKSAVVCHPGVIVEHLFKGWDDLSKKHNCPAEYHMEALVDPDCPGIRFHVRRRDVWGDDSRWCPIDANIEWRELRWYERVAPGLTGGQRCFECGRELEEDAAWVVNWCGPCIQRDWWARECARWDVTSKRENIEAYDGAWDDAVRSLENTPGL